MANMRIEKDGSGPIAHDLMHIDHDFPVVLRVKGGRLDMRINLAPLLRPVGADLIGSAGDSAFERLRPGHVGRHEGKGGIDVARIEGRIGRAQRFDFKCGWVWHMGPIYIAARPCANLLQVSRR